VQFAWLVHPVDRTLEVFQLDGRWTLVQVHEGEGEVAPPPFTEVSLPLGEVWGLSRDSEIGVEGAADERDAEDA
jgi:Uma2 family endonuclease